MEAKRLRGECFWCPEKFSSKCPNKQLYSLEINDDDDENAYMPSEEPIIDTTTNDPLISIHALTGVPSFSTMQVVGSTHNFIDEQLALKWNCHLEDISPMKVGVANGVPLICKKICRNFEWQMQGLWFKADVLVISLRSYDMGSHNNKLSLCSMEVMQHLLSEKGQVEQGHVCSLKVDDSDQVQHKNVVSNTVSDEKLNSLLQEFEEVFKTPINLPPHRAFDHKIISKDEYVTINQKPYRYQLAQKYVIEKMTKELLDTGVIKVYSKTIEQHLVHLNEVLEVLKANQLFAKMSKCSFGGSSVEYLGDIITKEEVATDLKKIEAIRKWHVPSTIKQLRGLLGLSGYYRRFIKFYGILAKPLTNLLRKDSLKWGKEASASFCKLKKALCTPPILALPDFSEPFVLETDACRLGIRAVLMQEGHPSAFISRALYPRQQVYSIYEKELLAILFAVKHWH
ncbi:uncharacterized protein LOC143606435 [Bidens hawaiensis]|uniref:uncharacterized protein LOC143606435 n=1 Tax=Bidens hawaiensis TaxID=980011 RepID=UPI00404AA990